MRCRSGHRFRNTWSFVLPRYWVTCGWSLLPTFWLHRCRAGLPLPRFCTGLRIARCAHTTHTVGPHCYLCCLHTLRSTLHYLILDSFRSAVYPVTYTFFCHGCPPFARTFSARSTGVTIVGYCSAAVTLDCTHTCAPRGSTYHGPAFTTCTAWITFRLLRFTMRYHTFWISVVDCPFFTLPTACLPFYRRVLAIRLRAVTRFTLPRLLPTVAYPPIYTRITLPRCSYYYIHVVLPAVAYVSVTMPPFCCTVVALPCFAGLLPLRDLRCHICIHRDSPPHSAEHALCDYYHLPPGLPASYDPYLRSFAGYAA